MKMKNAFLSLTLVAAMLGGSGGIAHADLVTYFNFNDSNLVSDIPGSGPAPAQTTTITTSGFTPTFSSGSTTNRLGGDIDGQALTNAQGLNANGATFQFGVNLATFTNTTVSFATVRSNTGSSANQFRYSLDGTNFVSFANFAPTTSFVLQTFDLSAVSGLNGNANAAFQVLFGGATATTGTNRYDNIQVNASRAGVAAVPEPSTMALLSAGLASLALARRRRKAGDSVSNEEISGGALAI